jgi:Spy/CpxP family protein refolding chaperone
MKMKVMSNPFKLTVMALVVAMAGTVALSAMAEPVGGMRHGRGDHGAMMGGGGGMHLSGRMLDLVKATPEQRSQIQKIMESARTDMQAQRESRQALHDESIKLFTQPNVDANAAEALRQKMLAQHDAGSKRMMQAMLDASRVLTPEQRQTFADSMAKRRDMMQRQMQERRSLAAPKS